MVPTQLSLCLLLVPMNPHNPVLKISSSSTHTIGLKKKEDCPNSMEDKRALAKQ